MIQIQSETAASTELKMPMMALVSGTWYDDGQDLEQRCSACGNGEGSGYVMTVDVYIDIYVDVDVDVDVNVDVDVEVDVA